MAEGYSASAAGSAEREEDTGSISSHDSALFDFDFENGIQPYSFEPQRADYDPDDSTGDEEEEEEEDVHRLQSADTWCHCGNCEVMATVRECKCCHEYPKLMAKNMEADMVECFTDHPGFYGVCLNPWVLQAAYLQFRAQYGPQQGPIHERFRYTAYRHLVRWCWGYMGKDNRIILPSCVVTRIRKEFPSEEYHGFEYPALDQ